MDRKAAVKQIREALAVLEKPDALTPDAEKVKKMSEALVKANTLLDPLQQAIYGGNPDKADGILSQIRNEIVNFASAEQGGVITGDTNQPIPDMTE